MGLQAWSVGSTNKAISDPCNRVGGKGEAPGLKSLQFVFESVTSRISKLLVVAALFAFFVGPTFISYRSYLFRWDDSEYLARSITVSRAFWSWNENALLDGMVSVRPPALTLLGVPWGSLATWDAAGNCFITLAALISCMAALCLYLLLRIGVNPFYLILASMCVFASIGPYPQEAPAHAAATGLLADTLFAWTALAALLLIPYEARSPCLSVRGSLCRGILWGAIFSLGTMTKLNFPYFTLLIVPVLLFIRFRYDELKSALVSLTGFACCSAPSLVYLLRWGHQAFQNAKASSFGGVAGFYYVPLPQYLGITIRESPGLLLWLLVTTAAVICLVIKGRIMQRWPDFLALVIVIGFGIVVFSSSNREVRFTFPVIVALPFLIGILMSGKGYSIPSRSAGVAAALVFCGLLAAGIPMRHRPNRQSIGRCEAVLALAARCNVAVVHLATDSPTLNGDLMMLARNFSARELLISNTFAYQAIDGVPIEDDFRLMNKFYGLVVFQDRKALAPPFTNQRVSEYEGFVRRVGFGPIKVGDDTSAYLMHKPKYGPFSGCAKVEARLTP